MDTRADETKVSASVQEAARLSLHGPLHLAMARLKDVLHTIPAHPQASSLLADILTRLARYEEALTVLAEALASCTGDNTATTQLGEQVRQTEHAAATLGLVNGRRFEQGHLYRAVVPDGHGGYFVDTLGFPGLWEVVNHSGKALTNGAVLRFAKSLAVGVGLAAGRDVLLGNAESYPEMEGVVHVTDVQGEKGLRVTLELRGSAHVLRAEAPHGLFFRERAVQREIIARALEAPMVPRMEGMPADRFVLTRAENEGLPRVLLVSLGLQSDYGVLVLEARLRHLGFPAQADYIRDPKMLDAHVAGYRKGESFGGPPPHVVTVSVTDDLVDAANHLITRLREALPDAFLLIGGPTSQTPEQMACLVPDFDILVRGDGDEVLPRIAGILAQGARSRGLDGSRIQRLKKLAGGMLIRTGNRWICHQLHLTNEPASYRLALPRERKSLHYWHTSRGCPHDCRFCARWSGRRHRCVTPWEGVDPPDASVSKRSARALKEWLLARLCLEFDGQLTPEALASELERARSQRRVFPVPGFRDKVFIAITDDDFLTDRERIREFSRLVHGLGLAHYFEFSAICSVHSLMRRGTVDADLIKWLTRAGFRYLNLGTDGLCQATMDQNGKGYSLDQDVIPLNAHLRSRGFFVFNNVIFTTPYTILPELMESLVFSVVCPFPKNIFAESAIVGRIGTRFNNEDIVNQRFRWRDGEGEDRGHYFVADGYRIPKGFMEYALNGTLLSFADPKVRDLAPFLAAVDPASVLEKVFSSRHLEQVVERWRDLSPERAEMRALGRCIDRHRHRGAHGLAALRAIKEEMGAAGCFSFVQYETLLQGAAGGPSQAFLWLKAHRQALKDAKARGGLEETEGPLRRAVREKPWYTGARKDLIDLLLQGGRCAEAIEAFMELQVIEPDLPFYTRFLTALLKSLHLEAAFKEDRPLFHMPRYLTISPLFHLVATVRELAGERVGKVDLSCASPMALERWYAALDRITPKIVDLSVREASFGIREALVSGERVLFFGIPVHLEDSGETIVFECDRTRPLAPLTVSRQGAPLEPRARPCREQAETGLRALCCATDTNAQFGREG